MVKNKEPRVVNSEEFGKILCKSNHTKWEPSRTPTTKMRLDAQRHKSKVFTFISLDNSEQTKPVNFREIETENDLNKIKSSFNSDFDWKRLIILQTIFFNLYPGKNEIFKKVRYVISSNSTFSNILDQLVNEEYVDWFLPDKRRKCGKPKKRLNYYDAFYRKGRCVGPAKNAFFLTDKGRKKVTWFLERHLIVNHYPKNLKTPKSVILDIKKDGIYVDSVDYSK